MTRWIDTNKYIFKIAGACLGLLLINGCLFTGKKKTSPRITNRAIYYWKSVFALSETEQQRLDSLGVKLIYLKFFDVDWDASTGQAIPLAKLGVRNKNALTRFQIIPTVFITNECFRQLDSLQSIHLAEKTYDLIRALVALNGINPPVEIQLDCDWTQITSNNYFTFLQHFKQLTNIPVSATIRLHQVKYLANTGVPPVDRGLLMCYNMGNLNNPATTNSILETDELKKYSNYIASYPLDLDVGLPVFGWMVLHRNQIYKGLIENIPVTVFKPSFSRRKGTHIELLSDTLLSGYELKKGDILRIEQSEIPAILSAADEINHQLKNTALTVSLFHLDSLTLSKYTTHELESIYNSFH